MRRFKLVKGLSAVLLCFGLFSMNVHALKSDSGQPITIDSNHATYDEKGAVSVYTGDVVLVQGTLKVKSDKLVVYLESGEVQKLVATGKPARFRQVPSEGKDEIKGKSLIAEYYPDKELLIMMQEAVVWQGSNSYASELIEYDSKNSIVKAGEQSSDTKRVRVILKPKAKEQSPEKVSE